MDVVFERRLARRASIQSGLVTRKQLVGFGLSRGQIARLLQAGRLVRTTGDVYLVGGAPSGGLVDLAAACLATRGVASHRSAAHLHGLIDLAPVRSEVTVGSTQGVRRGPLMHRSRDLLARDIVRITGIRTTNATRTLIDLGGVVPAAVLETALERALHARLTTFDRLVRRSRSSFSQSNVGYSSTFDCENDLETLQRVRTRPRPAKPAGHRRMAAAAFHVAPSLP